MRHRYPLLTTKCEHPMMPVWPKCSFTRVTRTKQSATSTHPNDKAKTRSSVKCTIQGGKWEHKATSRRNRGRHPLLWGKERNMASTGGRTTHQSEEKRGMVVPSMDGPVP